MEVLPNDRILSFLFLTFLMLTFVQSTRMQGFLCFGDSGRHVLTLPMLLRLLPSKVQGRPSKPYHVGIHWIALAEYSQMSTHMPGFHSFFMFLDHFVLAKLATSSIRDNQIMLWIYGSF